MLTIFRFESKEKFEEFWLENLSSETVLRQYNVFPMFKDRVLKVTQYLDSSKDEQFGWVPVKGSKYKFYTLDDENGRMMIKGIHRMHYNVMHMVAVLYENDYLKDWVKSKIP